MATTPTLLVYAGMSRAALLQVATALGATVDGATFRHADTMDALDQIQRSILTMSTAAVTRADLDSAFQNLIITEQQRDAVVLQAFNDLEQKIAAGQVQTPEDFSAELAVIKTLAGNAAAITQAATTADPGTTNVANPTQTVDNGTATGDQQPVPGTTPVSVDPTPSTAAVTATDTATTSATDTTALPSVSTDATSTTGTDTAPPQNDSAATNSEASSGTTAS